MEERESLVTVYRLRREIAGAIVSPHSMWGTLEAIAALDGCIVVEDSAREIRVDQLDGGFYFEVVAAASVHIDEA